MTTDETGSSSRISFGQFEVDLQAGELLCKGVRIKLQQQPFQVLAALLERPGSVVTREDLHRRLWAARTFVDFERGLNKAMNRLREVLGDSSEAPRFIETLPKRGYRFIARVEPRFGSIAVLPLENLSGDPSQDYWADGITDELITMLAQLGELRVISRTSVMRFKKTRLPVAAIARELGVRAIVEGSVVVANGKVRIRAQLVDAITDRHLWAKSYDRELGDIVMVQQEIAEAIAQQIVTRLTSRPDARFTKIVVNPEAYEAYLKGRFFLNKRTAADLEKSIDCFNRAIRLDAQYATAYAGLADAYTIVGILGIRPPREVYPEAKKTAEHALRLEEALAEPHCSLAVAQYALEWDFHGAEREFKRAFALNPNLSAPRFWYSAVLAILHRTEEALEEAQRGRELDPLSPLLNALLGLSHMFARRQDEAIEASHRAVELDPHNPFVHHILARTLDARGDLRQALVESEAAAKLSGNSLPFSPQVAYAHARLGNLRRAIECRDRLKALASISYVSPYHFALIDTGLGDKDSAFTWLERACEERTTRLTAELQGDPVFDDLRKDPRFDELRLRIGLPL